MVSVLLLCCIGLMGGCVQMLTSALIDLRRPTAYRIHHKRHPRYLIWGGVGVIVAGVILFLAFPAAAAIALSSGATILGILSAIAEHWKFRPRYFSKLPW